MMKKIVYTIVLLLLSLGLASCKTKDVEAIDITVQVVEETMVSNHIEVHVVVPMELESMDELTEITLNIASQTYEKHFDVIGTNAYTLLLVLYSSVSNYDSEDASYGQYTFFINKNVTTPGLSLGTNGLIFGTF